MLIGHFIIDILFKWPVKQIMPHQFHQSWWNLFVLFVFSIWDTFPFVICTVNMKNYISNLFSFFLSILGMLLLKYTSQTWCHSLQSLCVCVCVELLRKMANHFIGVHSSYASLKIQARRWPYGHNVIWWRAVVKALKHVVYNGLNQAKNTHSFTHFISRFIPSLTFYHISKAKTFS